MTLTPEITRLRRRRRAWAWTGFVTLVGTLVLLFVIGELFPKGIKGAAGAVLVAACLTAAALAVLALSVTTIDTLRLARRRHAAQSTAGSSLTALAYERSRGAPVRTFFSRLFWVLQGLRMVLLLLFIAYFALVQADAIAYLAGNRSAEFGGATPPTPIDGNGSAITAIVVGLFFEAIAVLIFLIVGAVLRQRIARNRHPARYPSSDQYG